MPLVVYEDNDNLIWVLGLTNNLTEAFVTTASGTAQLKDVDGANVGSAVTLSYQSGSRTVNGVTYTGGNYAGTLEEDEAIVAGTSYTAHVDIDATGDLKAHWEIPVLAATRTS